MNLIDRANLAILAAPSSPAIAPDGSDQFLKIMGWVKWGGGFACVIGLIVAGAMMALDRHRGQGGEHGKAVGLIAIGSVLVGIAPQLVTGLGA